MKYVLLDDDEPEKAVNSPGKRLRAARERLGQDIKTVARKLHINEESIIALENDDYDKFPAPIYVSGFLRNYARLLNLPPEPIVESYESLGKEAPPILSDLTSKIPRRRRNRIEPWKGYLAAAGILLMLVVWVLPSNNNSVHNEDVQPQPENTPAPVTSSPTVPDNEPIPETSDNSTEDLTPENDSSKAVAVEPSVPIPSDTLVLHFKEDSWVDITDSTGRRVFYSMGRAGETSTLLGIAPFSILLGYSPGVSIEYNGKLFDQTPYVKQDVARFRLGKHN